MRTTSANAASTGSDERSHGEDHEDLATVTERTGLLNGDDEGARSAAAGQSSTNDSWPGFREFDGLPWYRYPSVYWMLVPYGIFALAFGGSLVPKLNLAVDLLCRRYFSDRAAADPTFEFHRVILGGENPQCQVPEVQQSVAVFTLCLSVVTGVLSALTAPRLGSLSDRYGRKRIMAVCSLGGICSEIIVILCAKYPDTVNYRWLVFGCMLDGLTGSFTAGSILSHSYTSDCTPPSRRGVAIGYLHSCLFSGLAFGPLLAGYLYKWTDSLLTIFYVVLGCHLGFVLFIIFILPESVSRWRQLAAREKFAKEQDSQKAQTTAAWTSSVNATPLFGARFNRFLQSLGRANPFAPLRVLLPKGGAASARLRRNLLIFAAIDVTILGAAIGAGMVVILYSELMFGWGTFETSRFVSMVSLVRVFVLVAIFPVVNYFFRARPLARLRRESATPVMDTNAGADVLDLWVIRVALLSDVLGVLGYIFVRSPALFVLSGAITAVGGLGSATIQAVITKHVPADRVGQVLGAIGLLHALSRVFAPILFNGMYAATVKTFPQAFFVLLVSLFGLSLVGAFVVRPHVFMREEDLIDAPPAGQSQEIQPDGEDAVIEEEVVPRI